MAKVLTGTVVSVKMNKSIVVEVTRRVAHPLYKKLVKKSKKFLADSGERQVQVGEVVDIIETKPISKNKHFQLVEEKK